MKNHLAEFLETEQSDEPLPSKNSLRRRSVTVESEMKIIFKIICDLRGIYATDCEDQDNSAVIDLLDKELEEIGAMVDVLTENVSNILKKD